MTGLDFYDKVEQSDRLELQYIKDGCIMVYNTVLKTLFSVEVETILNNTWDVLFDIFTGKREPDILRHMSRVVGYYSQTENWNKSKLGELEARRNGVKYYAIL